jgi:hypothetical protein
MTVAPVGPALNTAAALAGRRVGGDLIEGVGLAAEKPQPAPGHLDDRLASTMRTRAGSEAAARQPEARGRTDRRHAEPEVPRSRERVEAMMSDGASKRHPSRQPRSRSC